MTTKTETNHPISIRLAFYKQFYFEHELTRAEKLAYLDGYMQGVLAGRGRDLTVDEQAEVSARIYAGYEAAESATEGGERTE